MLDALPLNMNPSSDSLRETARKNESAILQRLASAGQKAVADALDVSESTISRWKDGDVQRTAMLLAYLELQLVPTDHVMVDPARHRALMLLAQDGIAAHQAALDGDGR